LGKIVQEADTDDTPERVCAVFLCEKEIAAVEKRNKQGKCAVYCAVEKGMRHKSVRKSLKRLRRTDKLKTKEGKTITDGGTGIIRTAMGLSAAGA
jgi:hypothetical protein